MSKLDKRDKTKVKIGARGKLVRPGRGEIAPNFDTMFDPVDGLSVFDLPDVGDPEGNIDQEISAALAAVIEERHKRREAFRVQMDVNFWFAVCFQTETQKEEFLERAGLKDLGTVYLDGLQVASRLGVDIEPIMLPRPATGRTPVKLREAEVIKLHESKKKEVIKHG